MDDRFSDLAKAVASGLSRRDALRRLLGAAAGACLAVLGLGKKAHAQADCPLFCQSLGIAPNTFAFLQCVRNCMRCSAAGGTRCGGRSCCFGEEVCCPDGDPNGTCVSCPEGTELDPETCTCSTVGCENPGVCGNAPLCDEFCVCFLTVEGNGFCHLSQLCEGSQPCVSSADCPDGFACSTATCCEPRGIGICIQPCNVAVAAVPMEGPTTTGF